MFNAVAHPRAFRKQALILFFISAFFQGFCLVLIPASSFVYKSSRYEAISDAQYGLLFLPMIFVGLLSIFLAPSILKRIGEKALFYWGLLFQTLFLTGMYASFIYLNEPGSAFRWVFLACIFLDLGFWSVTSSVNYFVMGLFPEKKEAILTAVHGFFGVGAMAAPLIINFFYDRNFWQGSLFLGIAGFLGTAIYSTYCNLRRTEDLNIEKKVAIPMEKNQKNTVIFIAGTILLYGMLESVFSNWLILYLIQAHAWVMSDAAKALSLFWASFTIGRLLLAFGLLKVNPRLVFKLAPVVCLLSLFVIEGFHTSTAPVFIFVSLAGAAFSAFFPLGAVFLTEASPAHNQFLSSLSVSSLVLGLGIGSLITGFLIQHGFFDLSNIIHLCIFLGVVLLAGSLRIKKKAS